MRKVKDKKAPFTPARATGTTERRRSPEKPTKRTTKPKVVVPEEMLARALAAQTPRSRAIWARRGLTARTLHDRTTQALLLRQLYLAYYEEKRFALAVSIAERTIELSVLADVAHQDAARAKQAQGDVEGAACHLRLAARVGPASRKAFHWWTLGSLFFLARRYDESIAALSRAARWGTTDKPLYQGHLALAQHASGVIHEQTRLDELIRRLHNVPAGQGYGRFVLGLLALLANRQQDARRFLKAFVKRSSSGRRVLLIALQGEIAFAEQALRDLSTP